MLGKKFQEVGWWRKPPPPTKAEVGAEEGEARTGPSLHAQCHGGRFEVSDQVGVTSCTICTIWGDQMGCSSPRPGQLDSSL